MADQLPLFAASPPPPPPPGLPPAVAEILHVCQSAGPTLVIRRGSWGIGIGTKRQWVVTHRVDRDTIGCCAIGAYLLVKGAVAGQHENSSRDTVMRLLRLTAEQIESFVRGFDGKENDGTAYYEYGALVARETIK
jgi:hypothetical protein